METKSLAQYFDQLERLEMGYMHEPELSNFFQWLLDSKEIAKLPQWHPLMLTMIEQGKVKVYYN